MFVVRIMCPGAILLLLTADVAVGQSTHSPSGDRESLPRVSQVVKRAHELLGKHSSAAAESERVKHVLPIVRLVQFVSTDPRFATSPTLHRVRGWLVSRLRRVQKGLEADLRRDRKRPQEIKIDVHTLAQLNAAVGGAAAPQGRNAGRNFPDYGPLLVQLIQSTISPASWDVNGGTSTIVYYRPGRALVVRAPQSLHGKIGPLLGQLQGR